MLFTMISISQTVRPFCRITLQRYCRLRFLSPISQVSRRHDSSETLAHPAPSGSEKNYPMKIKNIVEEISKLTLIEVADLNELLKKTLNIKETPMMAVGAVAAAPADEEDEVAKSKTVKTSFTVKLTKFDESKKVALIKEVKNNVEGMNLVQAKKFVESAPQIVKADLSKDEAENLQKALEAAGGTCEID